MFSGVSCNLCSIQKFLIFSFIWIYRGIWRLWITIMLVASSVLQNKLSEETHMHPDILSPQHTLLWINRRPYNTQRELAVPTYPNMRLRLYNTTPTQDTREQSRSKLKSSKNQNSIIHNANISLVNNLRQFLKSSLRHATTSLPITGLKWPKAKNKTTTLV